MNGLDIHTADLGATLPGPPVDNSILVPRGAIAAIAAIITKRLSGTA